MLVSGALAASHSSELVGITVTLNNMMTLRPAGAAAAAQ
jgi:hypothetical protein